MRFPKLKLPLRTTLLYLLFGGLWILLSDQILSLFILHAPQQAIYQTLKGWFFILVSGILLYVLLLRELAARKLADETLRESEERYRLIAQHAEDMIWTMNMNLQLTYISPAVEWALGYSTQEILALPPERFLTPESYAVGVNVFKAEIENAQAQPDPNYARVLELEYRRKDGSTFWVEMKFSLFRDSDKRPTGVLGVGRDITQRKQAEAQLGYQAYLLDNVNDAIIASDENYVLRAWNNAAETMYGWKAEEVLGKNGLEILQTRLMDADADELRRQIGKSGRYVGEATQLRKDGTRIPVEVASIVLRDAEGKITGYVSVNRDITERKRAEAEMQSRSRQLTALLEASQSLTESLNRVEVLQKLTDKAADVLGVETTAIYLVEGEHLYLGASTPPLPVESPETFRRAMLADHPHIAEALVTWQPVVLPDVAKATLTVAEQTVSEALGLRTILYVPLVARKEAVGILIMGTVGKPREISQNERDVAHALSNQAALAIANVKLYEDLSLYVKELESQIAERKRADEEILSLSKFPSENPNPVIRVTQDGTILYANPASENILKSWKREVGQRVAEEWHEYVNQALVTGTKTEVEIESSGKHYSCILSPVQGADYLNIYCYNITERKRAEEQIQRQLKYLNALRMIDIAISSSFDLNIILEVVLQQVHTQLGVDASAILLFNAPLQTAEYAASRGFRSDVLRHTRLKLGEGYASQAVLKRKTIHISALTEMGSKLAKALQSAKEEFVDYYGAPLIVKGEVKGVLEIYHRSHLKAESEWLEFLEALAGQAAIAIDNAQLFESLQRSNLNLEQRVVERTAELNRTNTELEHANRIKDEFLANMSHELRTPLTSILGLSESLREQRRGSLNAHQEKSLEMIESSGRHLLELINDILDLSKIEAGKFDYYPQPISVDDICRSSLAFVKTQAAKKSITVTYEPDLSASKIFADPRRLKQILVNLLSNAVKFTLEHGQVILQVKTDLDQDVIGFSVIDNGIGIAPQDLQRLFQPFVQVDSGLNRQHEGTGLGLALVQKLTDLHGGSVQVESEVGKGSRFTVNLPCLLDEVTKLEKLESLPVPLIGEKAENTQAIVEMPAHTGVILLADDNMPSILTIGEYLESHGYKVVAAHDGAEALKQAETIQPDLILMDIQMPVMNGLEAIARLRGNVRFTATPIIALTALAMPGDRERSLLAGANEYMSKPASLNQLAKTIQGLLGK